MTSGDVKKAANDISNAASEALGTARSSASAAASSVKSGASEFVTRASDKAGDVYESAHGHLRDAAERIPDAAADALASGQRLYNKSTDTVARRVVKQPIEALLLAAAIGYLVGWATNRS